MSATAYTVSSENTSQVVENAYLLLEFSSPGVSARAHLVSSENTLQVAENTRLLSARGIFISWDERNRSYGFVVTPEAVPVAGRFDSAAGDCAGQQITRRVLLSHLIPSRHDGDH